MSGKIKKISRENYKEFLKTLPRDVCYFCKYKEFQIVLSEWKNWIAVEPISPYFPYHMMLCSKRHARFFSDLNTKEKNEFLALDDKIQNAYKKAGIKTVRMQIHFRHKNKPESNLYKEHLHIHYYRFKENDFAHLIPKNNHKTKAVKKIQKFLNET